MDVFTTPAAWLGGSAATIRFCRAAPDPRFERFVRDCFAQIEFRPGTPEPLLELRDVVFFPRWASLYDATGRRIDETCVRRSPRLVVQEHFSGPPSMPVPRQVPVVEGPVLFLGKQFDHWGHFLTEGISRFWPLGSDPALADLPILAPGLEKIAPEHNVMACLRDSDLPLDQVLRPAGPVRLARCLVPMPSFTNRAQVFDGHARFPQAAGERVLAGTAPPRSDQPVYLSRTRLSHKAHNTPEGEAALEAGLAARGVLVVHPQELSYAEQVRIYRGHRRFIGCSGSAFFNTAFARPKEVATYALRIGLPHPTYLMMDAILGVEAHYLDTLHPTEGAGDAPLTAANIRPPRGAARIDVDATLGWLAELGVIPRRR